MFINPLLSDLENSGYGLRIGNNYCGTPTCADDILLPSDSPSDLITMVKSVQDYASKEHYEISTTKTKTMVFNPTKRSDTLMENGFWLIDDKLMEIAPYYTHMGNDRAATLKWYYRDLISKRNISTARQTPYYGSRASWAQWCIPQHCY